ncbi:MAG: aminotransferase class I/II-fold pyridoxal phosphate-dependent enzyme [Bacteroidota bacterium]
MNLSQILNHLGENRSQYFNAISPPVIQSSNFAFDTLDDFRKAFQSEFDSHIYTRGNNPTAAILRAKLAALEGAEEALVFGSGSAAIASAVIGQVSAGDHIVCVRNPYSWTHALLTKFLDRFGVSHTFVDGRNLEEMEAAIRPETKVLFLESPNSITFELQDLSACADVARRHQLVSIIDNSYCSPYFQNPIAHGIDIVVHSGTKYLNGHSDVVLGVVCGSRALLYKIFESELMTLGAVLPPHDAALAIRGLRTFELRMQRSNSTAQTIVQYLQQHPKVEQVIYPLAEDFPQYELAQKQMRGCGGLFSILLKANNRAEVEAFFHRLKRFLLAVSWGGHESLVLPFAAFYDIEGRPDTSISWKLVRLYIGLEDPDFLIEDLEKALEVVGTIP